MADLISKHSSGLRRSMHVSTLTGKLRTICSSRPWGRRPLHDEPEL